MTEQEEQFLLAAWRLSAPDHIGTTLVAVKDDLHWDYQTTVDIAVILHESGAIDTPEGGSIVFESRGRLLAKGLADKIQKQMAVQVISPGKPPGVGATIGTQSGPKSENSAASPTIARPQSRRTVAPPNPMGPPRIPPAAVPLEAGNEVAIPEAFKVEDFDVDELRYLLAAYQLNDGGQFNWRALPNDLHISIHGSDVRAAQLQSQGALRVITSDGQAQFTDTARAFLQAMLTDGRAADCMLWTNGQQNFVLSAAHVSGLENKPFVHANLQQYKGDDVRRDLIQRKMFEATGPNNVKTRFTTAGLGQLRAAYARRGQPEFASFNRTEIAAIDKHLSLTSNLKMITQAGERLTAAAQIWSRIRGDAKVSENPVPPTAMPAVPVTAPRQLDHKPESRQFQEPQPRESMGRMPDVNNLLDRVKQAKNTSPMHRALYGISLVLCLLLILGFSFSGRWQWALFGGVVLIAATILWYIFDSPKSRHADITKWLVVFAFGVVLVLLLVKLGFVLFQPSQMRFANLSPLSVSIPG